MTEINKQQRDVSKKKNIYIWTETAAANLIISNQHYQLYVTKRLIFISLETTVPIYVYRQLHGVSEFKWTLKRHINFTKNIK